MPTVAMGGCGHAPGFKNWIGEFYFNKQETSDIEAKPSFDENCIIDFEYSKYSNQNSKYSN